MLKWYFNIEDIRDVLDTLSYDKIKSQIICAKGKIYLIPEYINLNKFPNTVWQLEEVATYIISFEDTTISIHKVYASFQTVRTAFTECGWTCYDKTSR